MRRLTSPSPRRRTTNEIAQHEAIDAAQQEVVRAGMHLARVGQGQVMSWDVRVPREDLAPLLMQQAGFIQTLIEQNKESAAREGRSRSPFRRGFEKVGRVALAMVGVNAAQAQEAAEMQRQSVAALQAVLQDPHASDELRMHASTQLAEHAKLAHANVGGAMRLPMCLLVIVLLALLLHDGSVGWLAGSLVNSRWGAPPIPLCVLAHMQHVASRSCSRHAMHGRRSLIRPSSDDLVVPTPVCDDGSVSYRVAWMRVVERMAYATPMRGFHACMRCSGIASTADCIDVDAVAAILKCMRL